MAAFSQIVRMWRDRKRRSEAKTLTMMNGNKLRKDNGIESSHVVGILSRRMIREVPALTFFDAEPETIATTSSAGATKTSTTTSSTTKTTAQMPNQSGIAAATLVRNTPRGVCYTLDANGCRCIKMESGALRNGRAYQNDRQTNKEEITIEKAMAKTLHRK
uniref:Uncharacterized protein n=1 Tax=Globisporangium ultimum (strain ATCC 200006 / CBS 805.95 / DAOM BR144) TaxID=431595 RepID=K3WGJ5_GLOUD